ncbi:hypothetical protein SCUP234_13169 [Seiridium cupressi]
MESTLIVHVEEVVFAASHLVALYQDDIQDATDYAGIEYINPVGLHYPIVWESAASYAGHGFDYQHIENFTLGRDVMKSFASSEVYWADIRRTLSAINTECPLFREPDGVLVTGSLEHGCFMAFLEFTRKEYLGTVPPSQLEALPQLQKKVQ